MSSAVDGIEGSRFVVHSAAISTTISALLSLHIDAEPRPTNGAKVKQRTISREEKLQFLQRIAAGVRRKETVTTLCFQFKLSAPETCFFCAYFLPEERAKGREMDFSQATNQVSTVVPARRVSLKEMRIAGFNGEIGKEGVVVAWLVGFDARNPMPRRFTYRACPFPSQQGQCWRSIELGDKCGHRADPAKCVYGFRFKLLLCDPTGPTWTTTFDSVSKLLGIGAADFHKLDPKLQQKLVMDLCLSLPLCQFRITIALDCFKITSARLIKLGSMPLEPDVPLSTTSSSSSVQQNLEFDDEEYPDITQGLRNL